MAEAIVIAAPTNPQQLMLLFHGVGSSPDRMAPLGQRLAEEFPDAYVICVSGPYASDLGQGYQWFSVMGITEENRVGRIAAVVPLFEATVKDWQKKTGMNAGQTTLIGFSQGSIISLESTRLHPMPAKRIVSIAGRFAVPPVQPDEGLQVHFFHGQQDPVVAFEQTVAAVEQLKAFGVATTADFFPGLKHEINGEVVEKIVGRLKG